MKIIEYKFLFEDRKKSREELKEGIDDLNFRLSFFLSSNKTKNNKNIQDSISNFQQSNNNQENALSILEKDVKEKSINNPKEIKKLHRKIVSYIHPDKLPDVPDDILEKYKEYYHLVTVSWEEKQYSNIIMIADSLLINVNDELISKHIEPAIPVIQKEINEIKNHLGYIWYNLKEEAKDIYFKKILDSYGFKYSDEDIEDVIKRPVPNRKTGTRPKNLSKRKRINGRYKNNSNS